MTRRKSSGVHVFTARMDKDEYEAVQAFAFFNQVSVNEFVLRAIRKYLTRHTTDTELDLMIEQRREAIRTTRERLGEG